MGNCVCVSNNVETFHHSDSDHPQQQRRGERSGTQAHLSATDVATQSFSLPYPVVSGSSLDSAHSNKVQSSHLCIDSDCSRTTQHLPPLVPHRGALGVALVPSNATDPEHRGVSYPGSRGANSVLNKSPTEASNVASVHFSPLTSAAIATPGSVPAARPNSSSFPRMLKLLPLSGNNIRTLAAAVHGSGVSFAPSRRVQNPMEPDSSEEDRSGTSTSPPSPPLATAAPHVRPTAVSNPPHNYNGSTTSYTFADTAPLGGFTRPADTSHSAISTTALLPSSPEVRVSTSGGSSSKQDDDTVMLLLGLEHAHTTSDSLLVMDGKGRSVASSMKVAVGNESSTAGHDPQVEAAIWSVMTLQQLQQYQLQQQGGGGGGAGVHRSSTTGNHSFMSPHHRRRQASFVADSLMVSNGDPLMWNSATTTDGLASQSAALMDARFHRSGESGRANDSFASAFASIDGSACGEAPSPIKLARFMES